MALSSYYSKWHLQDRREMSNPFPGHSPPREFTDKAEVQGLFIPDQTTESIQAAALRPLTVGRFLCAADEDVNISDTLRNDESGIFIRLTGEGRKAPKRSPTQVKQFPAVVVERPL